MSLSVIITTHDRRDDLAATLDALARLEPAPDEVLVCLDGCKDGSAEMLRTRHPTVRVLANPHRTGSIPSRDRLIRTAAGDLVLSLDDDSYPLGTDFVRKVDDLFTQDTGLAVLWFPQRSDEFPDSLRQTEFGPDCFTGTYSSSGAVLRRSVYLSLHGYFAPFVHAYEEPDFSLRCIAAGWQVRLNTGLVVRHRYSGRNRNENRTHRLHARNEQWSIWLRCPWPWWPLISLRRIAGQAAYAVRRGPAWIVREPLWWGRALGGFTRIWPQRSPVPWRHYRRWLRLLKHPEPFPDGSPSDSIGGAP